MPVRQFAPVALLCGLSLLTSAIVADAQQVELVSTPKKRDNESKSLTFPVVAASNSVSVPTAKPVEPLVALPVEKPTAKPVTKPAAAVTSKPADIPVAKAVAVPVAKAVAVSAAKAAAVPAAKPVPVAAAKPVTVPVAKPVAAPAEKEEFTFKDKKGKVVTAEVIDRYQDNRIVYPLAKVDHRLDSKLVRAASIAQERARAHSKSACWHYVKTALVASGVISTYPKSVYAKQAGEELVRDYGFKRLPIQDPYKAPIGAVLVYGSRRAAGHVELRTKTGFVSDFQNKKPSKRPLIGVYAKA
ncbi:MAG: hypothetical protein ACXV8A_06170 [Chthoniobacterales bacterium]